MPIEDVHGDPLSAWRRLAERGGIEPWGRDEPLITSLRNRIDPDAPDLETALSRVSLAVFLNAFFGVVSPFVAMMRDLLAYFEAAEASAGAQQWNLALGDAEKLEVDLDHFRQWVARAEKITTQSRVVPVLDFRSLWEMRKAFLPLQKPGDPKYAQPCKD